MYPQCSLKTSIKTSLQFTSKIYWLRINIFPVLMIRSKLHFRREGMGAISNKSAKMGEGHFTWECILYHWTTWTTKREFSQECFLQAKTWYKGHTVVEIWHEVRNKISLKTNQLLTEFKTASLKMHPLLLNNIIWTRKLGFKWMEKNIWAILSV